MPRITKVYTRTGDDGWTALGNGQRVPKTASRIIAYGTIDELSAQLGVVLQSRVASDLVEPLRRIQNELFHAGASLCVPEDEKADRPTPEIAPPHIAALEQLMDRMGEALDPLTNFVLPGGTPAAAQLHVARTVCRRAERDVLALAAQEPIAPHLVPYLNRLSDTLFVMARYDNKLSGVVELVWDSRA